MSEVDQLESESDLQYLPTNGGTALLLGKHKYHLLKKYKNGASIWRCSNYKKGKCLGTVTVKFTAMDLNNIFQTLLSQKRECENENGYSDVCVENSRENGDGLETPKDPTNLLHGMDNNIDTKQDLNIGDKDIIALDEALDEFEDILGIFNDNTMLTDEDLPSNDVNIVNTSKVLFDHSNTVFVDSDFQKQEVTVVEQVTNNNLLSKDNVFIDNDGKIEIVTSPKDHGVNVKTHQSNMNSNIGTTLPSFQEAFKIFCNIPFDTITQDKARKHNIQYENKDKSQKDKENELRITSIDATDDSGDDITLVEDQTEYCDSILTQNLKFIDNLTSDDINGIAMVQQEAANTTEYDSDCDGYHSSDFEFITESEAETCGIVVNSNKLTQRTRKNKGRTLNDSQNKLSDTEDNVLNDYMSSLIDNNNETAHKIPEGEDFFNLFLGHNAPIVPMHYMMENKSVGATSCMAVDNEGMGFNMGAMWRDDNVDDELKKDAERTVRKILNMYPSENYKLQRRH